MTNESFDFEQRAERQEIFLSSSVCTKSGAHTSSLSVGASASFSEGKVAVWSCTSTPSVYLWGMYVDNFTCTLPQMWFILTICTFFWKY
jgi:hypothetical protein